MEKEKARLIATASPLVMDSGTSVEAVLVGTLTRLFHPLRKVTQTRLR